MKNSTLILFWVVLLTAMYAYKSFETETKREAQVISTYDGDTFTAIMMDTKEVEKIRLAYINTPEMNGPNKQLAIAARDSLRKWIDNKRVMIDTQGDKRGYYKRLIGIIYINGININDLLLERGLARRYKPGEKW